ncbi:pseudouridine-5'-monophosphatase-like [Planoprotostelium fungivorum]|uniref:Pseudouridine-5'-monophosphatase-like n=1 Tax=Planoprotostelium fungivorum TaxID=1890364 RepID=A0A2P6NT07_9EUKA|nr:pseudouridine-5'-monophosphatase-like [Planoprotostelium fungivorum]
MAPITHVIFDMDGTLLDTESVYTTVTQQILDPYGHKFTWDIKSKMMGRKQAEAAAVLIESLSLPFGPEDYIKMESEKTTQLWPLVAALPGVVDLVEYFHKNSIPQSVATSSNSTIFKLKSQNHGDLFGRFETIVTGDDPAVHRGKPHPDIFQVCAERFGATVPQQVLVFEDALNGVLAAKAAGMRVVAIPDLNADKTPFLEHADIVLDSLNDFDPTIFGLPQWNDRTCQILSRTSQAHLTTNNMNNDTKDRESLDRKSIDDGRMSREMERKMLNEPKEPRLGSRVAGRFTSLFRKGRTTDEGRNTLG